MKDISMQQLKEDKALLIKGITCSISSSLDGFIGKYPGMAPEVRVDIDYIYAKGSGEPVDFIVNVKADIKI